MGQITKWQKGTVGPVFDNGDGYITCQKGERYYFSEYQNKIDVKKGEKIYFKLYVNLYLKQVDDIKRGA